MKYLGIETKKPRVAVYEFTGDPDTPAVTATVNGKRIALDEPVGLAPVHIPKPWGQEIWYTGVEERGVCGFGGRGASTPIPWLQAVLPDAVAGVAGEPLGLLKILGKQLQFLLPTILPPGLGNISIQLHEEYHL